MNHKQTLKALHIMSNTLQQGRSAIKFKYKEDFVGLIKCKDDYMYLLLIDDFIFDMPERARINTIEIPFR